MIEDKPVIFYETNDSNKVFA